MFGCQLRVHEVRFTLSSDRSWELPFGIEAHGNRGSTSKLEVDLLAVDWGYEAGVVVGDR